MGADGQPDPNQQALVVKTEGGEGTSMPESLCSRGSGLQCLTCLMVQVAAALLWICARAQRISCTASIESHSDVLAPEIKQSTESEACTLSDKGRGTIHLCLSSFIFKLNCSKPLESKSIQKHSLSTIPLAGKRCLATWKVSWTACQSGKPSHVRTGASSQAVSFAPS